MGRMRTSTADLAGSKLSSHNMTTCLSDSKSVFNSLSLTPRLTIPPFSLLHRYVYLEPIYTSQVARALTDVRVIIQNDPWTPPDGTTGTNDLAKGAGGKFRYLQFGRNTSIFTKYEAAVMLRKDDGQGGSLSEVPNYNVLTTDINKDRGGDFLYVAFRARDVFEITKPSPS